MKNRPTFCAIIPDRGDRPKLTEFCFRQLNRMTVKPDKVYHINYAPKSDGFDLVERVKFGLDLAHAHEMEWAFIIEDDYYPPNYFEQFIPYMHTYHGIGIDTTIYYNLRNRTHTLFNHPGRSSLFNTAIRVKHFMYTNLFNDQDPFLDIRLWQYLRKNFNNKIAWVGSESIGIKHNIGKCAGKGHRMDMPMKDPDLKWLRERLWLDNEAFDFYRSLSEEIYKP